MNSVDCLWCGAHVSPNMTADGRRHARPSSLVKLDPDRLFCSLRCGTQYAVDKARKYDARYNPRRAT